MNEQKILTLEEGGGFHKVALGNINPYEATAAIIAAVFRQNVFRDGCGMPDYKVKGNEKFQRYMDGFIKKNRLEDFIGKDDWHPFSGTLSNSLIMQIKWSGNFGSGEVGVSHKRKGFLALVKGSNGLIEISMAREIVNTANLILCGG